GVTTAQLQAGTTQQANQLAYQLGTTTVNDNTTVALGAQQVTEAQIASDTTLGTLTAQNTALEEGYNYNLGVVNSNNAAAVTTASNAHALPASLAATQAAETTANYATYANLASVIVPTAIDATLVNPGDIANIEHLTVPVIGGGYSYGGGPGTNVLALA